LGVRHPRVPSREEQRVHLSQQGRHPRDFARIKAQAAGQRRQWHEENAPLPRVNEFPQGWQGELHQLLLTKHAQTRSSNPVRILQGRLGK
jgi:hypothetical protein